VSYENDSLVVEGYDPDCFLDLRVCQWILVGNHAPDALGRVARGEAAMVSSAFAFLHDVSIGRSIEIDSPSGPLRLPVAAITNGQPQNAVVISRHIYRRLWNDFPVSWVHVALQNKADANLVATEIRRRLGEKYRLNVRSNLEMVRFFANQA